MAQNDRTTGLVGLVGCKVPVKAASTAALVLSGEQTVDGVALVTDDRVLVKDQANAVDNGIYVVDTGDWSRARDFDGSYDVVRGTIVHVNDGTQNGGSFWEVTSSDPMTISTSTIAFSRVPAFSVTLTSHVASAGQTLFSVGSTYSTGSQALGIYVNGLRQRVGDDYSETDASNITFTYALAEGDEVDIYVGQQLGNIAASAASASAVTDAADFYVGTTVEAVLQEIAQGIALDNGDANATFTNATSSRIQRWNTPLTANRTLTLSTSNAKEGAMVTAVRGSVATGNFTLAVGALATLRAPGEWARCRYDAGSGAWVLEAHGYLPSAGVRNFGADVGDADATLTVGSSSESQRWGTVLTADRTATLATAGAWSGAKFKVMRLEAATGNFALNVAVGSTRLIRLAPGQWATFEFNGSTWVVTGYGDLRPGLSSRVVLRDDFVGEEIDGYRWQSLVGTDPECRQAVMLADQVGGVVRLVTGDDAAATMAVNGVQLQSRLNWRADKGCLEWEGRIAISAITSVNVCIGLTDQVAAIETPFSLGAGNVLTSHAADAVGVLFDTSADNDNWWLVGVAAAVNAAKQNTGVAPVAGVFETWRIEVDVDGTARFYRNGSLIGTSMAGAVTPSAALTPVVAAFSRGAASRNIDVDLLGASALR